MRFGVTGRRYVGEHVARRWGLARGAVATCTPSVDRAGLRHRAGLSAGPLVPGPLALLLVNCSKGRVAVIRLRDREACSPGGRRECLCFAFWGEHWYANEVGVYCGRLACTQGQGRGIKKEGWWVVVAGVHVLCAAGND